MGHVPMGHMGHMGWDTQLCSTTCHIFAHHARKLVMMPMQSTSHNRQLKWICRGRSEARTTTDQSGKIRARGLQIHMCACLQRLHVSPSPWWGGWGHSQAVTTARHGPTACTYRDHFGSSFENSLEPPGALFGCFLETVGSFPKHSGSS